MPKLEQEKQVLLKKFHSLWVQSIGTPKHNKEEWKEVEALILDIFEKKKAAK